MDFPAGTGKDRALGFLTCSVCGEEVKLLICYFDICKGAFVGGALDGVVC